MEVIILKDTQQVSELAALHFKKTINENPQAVLGLATGSTPLGLYSELIKMHKAGDLDFSQVTSFNLDEYVGLESEHPASYFSYMKKNFFSEVNIKPENIFIPDGLTQDVPKECEKYERKIEEKDFIDLQVLGIGRDGHIGFNEPSSSLSSRTRLKTLTEQTRKDNSVHFDSLEQVPYHVLTMGVGTIMEARHIILLAFGESKAQAIAGCVEGPITAMNPASLLQLHPKATLIIDEGAATQLTRQSYYRWVYDNKPGWQKMSR
ncbi:MAG: glucosamine-6-phosphate deaminase [Bdellovibrionales bacterium]|nr:glucosamine-6-phosphate deaminase [Bdellovibrionales bacterium]NQZ19415.1 glucosamine-6-phosphate deaminase [Bdellovibrionales bacterium]